MASNILSRLLPNADGNGHQEPAYGQRQIDLEEAAGDDADSDAQFEDQDLEQLLAEGLQDDVSVPPSIRNSVDDTFPFQSKRSITDPVPHKLPLGTIQGNVPGDDDDDDDDVPQSLLLEDKVDKTRKPRPRSSNALGASMTALPGNDTQAARLSWNRVKARQNLRPEFDQPYTVPRMAAHKYAARRSFIIDPKQRAMWMWANVDNLDGFLRQVYYYFERHGIWSIILKRFISLLTALFVLALSTFVFFCIDYGKLPGSSRLEQVRVPNCSANLPLYWNLLIWIAIFSTAFITFRFLQDLPRLRDMHNFYHHLLDIPDRDLQTVTWPYVISKLMLLRDANPHTALNISPANRKFLQTQSKQRMDAHDIANRLMRRENYWISLMNKDMLNCTLDLPFLGKKHIYTRGLEWNISLCLMDFVFDENGQVRPQFTSYKKRQELADILRKRFFLAGLLNILISIPLAIWAITMRFLRSFAEYYKNPSALSIRKFSLYAEWKIRDLNEVPHIFNKRKRLAYPYSNRYLDQFPKDKFNQTALGISFVLGAFTTILALITMWDPDLFLGFEIAGRTVLFWLGILGTMFVTIRNAATDEDEDIWDPEIAMRAVIHNIHYCPDHWVGKLYSDEVRREFTKLYKLEPLLILEDLAGVILTPMILMWSLPESAQQLIDFFREFSVHVDGLGTVCSHALFNFKDGGKPLPRSGQEFNDLRQDYYGDKANKLIESYVSFVEQYGPNPRRAPHQHRSRQFNPPPNFPPMFDQSAAANTDAVALKRHSSSTLRHNNRQNTRQPPGITTRAAIYNSPMHSILLDPHHQPRGLSHAPPIRRNQRVDQHSTLLRHGLAEAGESEGEDGRADPSIHNLSTNSRTANNLLEDDSELGDSWMLKNEGSNSSQKVGDNLDANVGVLGMLNEFTRPKSDRRTGLI